MLWCVGREQVFRGTYAGKDVAVKVIHASLMQASDKYATPPPLSSSSVLSLLPSLSASLHLVLSSIRSTLSLSLPLSLSVTLMFC